MSAYPYFHYAVGLGFDPESQQNSSFDSALHINTQLSLCLCIGTWTFAVSLHCILPLIHCHIIRIPLLVPLSTLLVPVSLAADLTVPCHLLVNWHCPSPNPSKDYQTILVVPTALAWSSLLAQLCQQCRPQEQLIGQRAGLVKVNSLVLKQESVPADMTSRCLDCSSS
jgi:hypothetical protein